MPPDFVVFEGYRYRLSGRYYRRSVWDSAKRGYVGTNLHRDIWKHYNGPVPEGYEVHHRDGDPFNNDISNFELFKRGEHQRKHTLERIARGELQPPGDAARVAAAEWHRSDEGRAWHIENGKRTWENHVWAECRCQMCGELFRSPFPTRAKFCHQNCKAMALRKRRCAKMNDHRLSEL